MNADRRIAGKVVIELLNEGHVNGEISDQAHEVLGETLGHLQKQEYHQLRAQEKFEGKNASTDKQIAICRVALPALEKAVAAYNSDDFMECVTQVKTAIETDGTPPKVPRRKRRAGRA
ncbi:hypothetical protein SEA_MERCEDES_50 [Microbacterium phage Mercedes]|nr:hypothetical protein SEA_MERCEDES_50 [Microbacterium phage Mercedes]